MKQAKSSLMSLVTDFDQAKQACMLKKMTKLQMITLQMQTMTRIVQPWLIISLLLTSWTSLYRAIERMHFWRPWLQVA